MVGRVDCLVQREDIDHWKAKGIDLSAVLYNPPMPSHVGRRCTMAQDHGLDEALDRKLIEMAHEAIENRTPVSLSMPIRNVHRTVGAMLSGEIARRYGSAGLPDDTIRVQFTGCAGQSFGAFLAKGVTLTLEGEANDYVGKGLSGGKLIIYPPRKSEFVPEENILVGNVCLYGATSGEAFFSGMAGERFAVRNSGATAVVEGVGDHGCEYMTNGLVVVLGRTGRNFAAGMTGGIAYVLDQAGDFATVRCNRTEVDLEPVTDTKDIEMLHDLISRHGELTGSPQAKWILENWDATLPKFIKVFPHEYKRVLGIPRVPAGVLAAQAGETRATWAGDPWVRSPGSRNIRARLPTRRPVEERVNDYFEVYQPFPEEKVRTQAARCMDCGIPFCHTGCPVNNIIPDWNDLVYRDHWKEAIRVLHSTNNFPEFTGRICPAPCEAACVLGINEPPVTIKVIEKTIVEHAWKEGWIKPEPPEMRTGKRVAVVGLGAGGPGGRAATESRGPLGDVCLKRPTASAACCATAFRISRWRSTSSTGGWSRWRPRALYFRRDAHVGRNVPAEDLRKEFDAVLLTGGAENPRDLNVPGTRAKGHSFRDGISAAAEQAQRRRRSSRSDSRDGQARGDHRRRRHRRGLPGHLPPAKGEVRAPV